MDGVSTRVDRKLYGKVLGMHGWGEHARGQEAVRQAGSKGSTAAGKQGWARHAHTADVRAHIRTSVRNPANRAILQAWRYMYVPALLASLRASNPAYPHGPHGR